MRQYVTLQIYQLCSQKDRVEALEVNVQEDHVHVMLSIPPKYAVSDLMGFVKGKLALRLFDRYPEPRKRYWASTCGLKGTV